MTALDILEFAGALVIAALAGVAAGALVNALADRVVGVDEPVWSATQCRKCLAPLPPAPALALGEFISPRVCAQCGKRASLRRPLMQLALAALFPLLVAHALLNPGHPLAHNAATLPAWALIGVGATVCVALAFTFVVDLEHRLIYHRAIVTPMLVVLGATALFNLHALLGLLLAGALTSALFMLLYGLGWALYHKPALAFGDVELAALMGVVAGWPGITTALLVTLVGGAIAAAFLLASGAEGRSYFPYGVFIALGTIIALLTGPFAW